MTSHRSAFLQETLSRRVFGAALLASIPALGQDRAGSPLGSLYPPIRAMADESSLELSFLRPEFTDHKRWQQLARKKLFDLLHYGPTPTSPKVHLRARNERADFIEEDLTFLTTPDSRVPAHLLIPTGGRPPFPGVILLHDHGGFYLWGREKVVEAEHEHPVLTQFKQRYYSGRSIATEIVRQGYAVIAIDMFYWGERRYILPDDPPEWRDRPASITAQQIADFNRRSSQNEQLIARSLLTAGVTWPGVMLWDDIRTLDYFASRPEVDRNRIGCVGLSVGGYRSFMLAALDARIKVAVNVCWMTSFASQIREHVTNTMGLTFVIPGMYRYYDLPDLSALIAPRALMVQMGSRDRLFPLSGIEAAFAKIVRCYKKADCPDRQVCTLFDAPHEFNDTMQPLAWAWLKRWL